MPEFSSVPATDGSQTNNAVRYIRGVGPVREAMLRRLGIGTAEDLILFFPRRYEDRRNLTRLASLVANEKASLLVRVVAVESRKTRGRGVLLTSLLVSDGTDSATALWFNRTDIEKKITPGMTLALYGRIDTRSGRPVILNPEFEPVDEPKDASSIGRIVPVYNATAGLPQKWLRKIVDAALDISLPSIRDILPEAIRRSRSFPPIRDAVLEMHHPTGRTSWKRSRDRLAFEEFFMLQVALAMRRRLYRMREEAGIFPKRGPLLRRFLEDVIPFAPTKAQFRAIDEIGADVSTSVPMNRLLQGDVGSGKTVVAIAAALMAADGGAQAAVMAPTEILAQQHWCRIKPLLEPLGIPVVLLSGGAAGAERDETLRLLETRTPLLAVGTHALFSENVLFASLGLVVIDEQHRFGVLQKRALRAKGSAPHTLVMTATPIPRTMTLSVYGDLSVSVIDELPAGRLPVETRRATPGNRKEIGKTIRDAVRDGGQVYWVCPLVDESEAVQAVSVTERYESLREEFPSLRIGFVHGQLAFAERDRTMNLFAAGCLDLLVATTVIEVGVDIPNASVMIVENAGRFGLSQLHQLRGRIGRGARGGVCLLLDASRSGPARERIDVLCSTSDGFAIAEADLRLRGPGEVCGIRQHGITDFRVADLLRDRRLLEDARAEAFSLVRDDPDLLSCPDLRERVVHLYGDVLRLVETA
jgi:ATP-dependent DNA helicase RecG